MLRLDIDISSLVAEGLSVAASDRWDHMFTIRLYEFVFNYIYIQKNIYIYIEKSAIFYFLHKFN